MLTYTSTHRFVGASTESKVPELFLFYPERALKYRLEKPFNFKDGAEFLQAYQRDELKPFLKSAPVCVYAL
jgi:hypothetical protein